MQANIIVSAFTHEVPRHILDMRNAPSGDGCTSISMRCTNHQPLYRVEASIKPRTVEVLVKYALERLSIFGIPDLASWDVEVMETDGDFQVDFVNKKGARLCVDRILMTNNRCGVVVDHGLSASDR